MTDNSCVILGVTLHSFPRFFPWDNGHVVRGLGRYPCYLITHACYPCYPCYPPHTHTHTHTPSGHLRDTSAHSSGYFGSSSGDVIPCYANCPFFFDRAHFSGDWTETQTQRESSAHSSGVFGDSSGVFGDSSGVFGLCLCGTLPRDFPLFHQPIRTSHRPSKISFPH